MAYREKNNVTILTRASLWVAY